MVRISVIIATLNRPSQLQACLKSLFANSFKDFEIIIVDQSADTKTKEVVKNFKTPLLCYILCKKIGKANALNIVLERAKGTILAFTDDDCIVTKSWLSEIATSFSIYKDIDGLVGQVLPYKPSLHPGSVCPAITPNRKKAFVTKENYRFGHLGIGNNMAFRKRAMKGGFKEWLGVGTIGRSGIETEFIYRCIKENGKIYVNPKATVFHNRWLTKKENQKKQIQYTCGFLAFCTYYVLKGDLQGLMLGLEKVKRRCSFRLGSFLADKSFSHITYSFEELWYLLQGVFLGSYFYFMERGSQKRKRKRTR